MFGAAYLRLVAFFSFSAACFRLVAFFSLLVLLVVLFLFQETYAHNAAYTRVAFFLETIFRGHSTSCLVSHACPRGVSLPRLSILPRLSMFLWAWALESYNGSYIPVVFYL